MGCITACLILSSIGVAANSNAPETNTVSINIRNGTIYDVIAAIEKQSHYMFFFKSSDIENTRPVSINVSQEDVVGVLNRVADQTELDYKIEKNHILLSKKELLSLREISISGTVKDENGEPLYGVNVLVKGTSTGVITDLEGKYHLSVPEENTVLVFSFIGYESQEIKVDGRKTINVTMRESTLMVEELVVTALGMKRAEKALGYATQQIGGEQFEKVKGVNVATSMTGRISGMTVLNSSEFMESPTIKLRGEEPILILDGIPTELNLGDLNSDDILSIDVLKGATASALYGSRGRSGAIMITTKKGGKPGFSVSVNTSNMFHAGYLALPKVQTSYSAGYNGKYNTDDEVWGDKLDIGRVYAQWDPIAKEMRETELTSKGKNNFKNFLEFSMISNTTVSVSQQGENGSLRSSISYMYNKGQYPNTKAQQLRYTLGGEMKLNDKLTIEGTMGFTKRTAPNTSGTGYGNQGYIYNMLIWTGPEYDIREFRDYWITPDIQQNWHYAGWYDNPYLMAYEKLNSIDDMKTNGTFSLNYTVLPWLKALARVGFDASFDQTERRAPLSVNSSRNWGNTNKGYFQQKKAHNYSINSDFILTADKRFKKFSIEGLFGGSVYYVNSNHLSSTTRNGLSVPGFYSLKASVESPVSDVELKRKQVNSLFGKMTLGFMDAFYLDISGRNDWSSSLPSDEKSYFYPSVGGSAILSEVIAMPDWLKFLKLRGSWTVSKKDLDIYAINQSYLVSNSVWTGMNAAKLPLVKRGEIKPITDRTYEIGTAVHFLNNHRLKLDLSYFNKLTYNNTKEVPISYLSGYEKLLMNTREEFVTKGWELVVDATPVKTRSLTWNTVLNWSSARKYYAKIDDVYSPDKLWVYKGARADYREDKDFIYTADGEVVLQNGLPRLSDYYSKTGHRDPDWIWGWTNTFKYKNLTLSMSIDGRIGGLSESTTNRAMWQTGAHPETDNKWRYEEVVNGKKTYIAQGVNVTSGTATFDSYGRIITDDRVFAPNDVVVSYETYIKNYWRRGPQLIFDETYVKFRELSLSYDMPKSFVGKLGMSNASVALVGQNLLLWTKEYKYADPDKASDDLASPSLRYIGVNIKAEF